MNKYYLASLDSLAFESAREFLSNRIIWPSDRECLEGKIDPPVPGDEFGIYDYVSRVYVVCRHKGDSLPPAGKFPVFVYICMPKDEHKIPSGPDELKIIASGEIYQTYEDAVRRGV